MGRGRGRRAGAASGGTAGREEWEAVAQALGPCGDTDRGDLATEIERNRMGMIRGGRKRPRVIWSINFKKHGEGVRSGVLRRFVKLQWHGSNMTNYYGRLVNSKNCNNMDPINPKRNQ